MKRYYIATVQIAVLADSQAVAEDAISECLSGNLKQSGAILDWQHLILPIPGNETIVDPVGAEENELFIHLNP